MTKAHPVEGDVKRKGKDLLAQHGWFTWMPPANQFGKSGISDLHAVSPGVFMVVEFKLYPNVPTELQKAFLVMISEAGHLAFVVNDKNLPTFGRFLDLFAKARVAAEKSLPFDANDGAEMANAVLELSAPYQDAVTRFVREGRKALNV